MCAVAFSSDGHYMATGGADKNVKVWSWRSAQSKYLPSLHVVLDVGNFIGSAFCNFHRLGVPEQSLGGVPLGLGTFVKYTRYVNLLNLHEKA